MAIEFVVEDGTGRDDATSYVEVEDFEQYWENRGANYSAEATATIQAKLNIATQYVDYLHPYEGLKSSYTQALEFPRTIEPDVVPEAVKSAVCEAAAYELDGNSLETATEMITARRMGPVSITYGPKGKQSPKLTKVEKYLGKFVRQIGVSI